MAMTHCACCARTYYDADGGRVCAYCIIDQQRAAEHGFIHDATSHYDAPNRARIVPAWRRRADDPATARASDRTGAIRA